MPTGEPTELDTDGTDASDDAATGGGGDADGTHEVELAHEGNTVTVAVEGNESILDAAEAAGLDLPYSCRQGQCTSCVGRVRSGAVDQSEGTALDPTQRDDGFALLCIARPESDCRVETDVQDDLFGGDLDLF